MKNALSGLFLFLLGAGVGGALGVRQQAQEPIGERLAESGAQQLCPNTQFINPDFACGRTHVIDKAGYLPLVNDIERYIAEQKAAGVIEEVGVYFRDLRAGPVFGINESMGFIPASLLKLPLVLTYFDLAESGQNLLDVQIRYLPDTIPGMEVPEQTMPSQLLRLGEQYPVRALIEATLTESDNLAYLLLVSHLNNGVAGGTANVLRVLEELGVVDPRDRMEEAITPRRFTSILRTLYNVSYLDVTHSETVLGWLANSTFDEGLAAGIPQDIRLANKFGERSVDGVTIQLHDCGIVYFPGNPYALCVMTKGNSWDSMIGVVATISRMVWNEVDSRRL